MKKFNEFFEHQIYQREIETPSAEVQHSVYTLQLRFDSKDILYQAFYQGPQNPWMSSLCYLIQGKTLSELNKFSIENWKASFKDDQSFWDFYQEEEEQFVFSRRLSS